MKNLPVKDPLLPLLTCPHLADRMGIVRKLKTKWQNCRGRKIESGNNGNWCIFPDAHSLGTTPLTGEPAQASLRGRPRGRLGKEGSGKGRLRGRPRGRFGMVGSQAAPLRLRLGGFGSIQAAGAT